MAHTVLPLHGKYAAQLALRAAQRQEEALGVAGRTEEVRASVPDEKPPSPGAGGTPES